MSNRRPNRDSPREETSGRWQRWGVVTVGGLLVLLTLLYVVVQPGSLMNRLLLGSFPIFIGLLLVGAGYRLRTTEYVAINASVYQRWFVAGFLGIIILTAYFSVAAEYVPPANSVPRGYALLTTVGAGILYGVLLGQHISQTEQQKGILRERERELQRQVERLEEFSGVVSHDLRNPLNVAQGNLELLVETGDESRIERIETVHDRMETIIADALTLARSGQTVDALEPVTIQTVAESAWWNVRTDTATLSVDSDRTLVADRSRLLQIFENLFRNAIEHGGANVAIRVGSLPNGFYVEDDGSGIPEEHRDTVFDAGHTTSADGTGFGLAIVRQIANAHGWSVTATGAVTGGARFEFRDDTE